MKIFDRISDIIFMRVNNGGCMFCNRMRIDDDNTVGTGTHFERIRRITGYLVGTMDRFNDGKKAECLDRVKHMSFKDKDNEVSN